MKQLCVARRKIERETNPIRKREMIREYEVLLDTL